MNPQPRSMSDEDKALIEQYLKSGGEVTHCNSMEKTDPDEIGYTNNWGRGRKKKTEKPVDTDSE